MKLIIAGSRNFPSEMDGLFHSLFDIYSFFEIVTEVVEGGCKGVDSAAVHFAEKNYGIPTKRFEADWEEHGKAAGPIRNREMAKYADALLLIWDGTSRGSKNMKSEMTKLNKPIYEVIIKQKQLEEDL